MPQGFNSNRHRVKKSEMSRWAMYRHSMVEDPIPDHPEILALVIRALSGRVHRMERTKGGIETDAAPKSITRMRNDIVKLLNRIHRLDRTRNKELAGRIGIYVGVIAQRCRYPGELEENWLYRLRLGHYEELFEEELRFIEKEKLIAFTCIHAVLRLQRDWLYEYMNRSGLDGYFDDDRPASWLGRNRKRLHEELTFYRCSCVYASDLSHVDCTGKGPGELIPAILAGLHKGITATSIRQILKRSARLSKLPSFLS